MVLPRYISIGLNGAFDFTGQHKILPSPYISTEQIAALVKMQLTDNKKWTFSSFTTDGASSYQPTFSIPGRNLYVIIPDAASVNQAKEMIEKIRQSQ